jgi:Dolichyl-phosphate-mannose-protein mannosyltransferase
MAATQKSIAGVGEAEAARPAAHARARYVTWALVALIVLGALALRLWGIRQSLPYVEQPDEPNPIDYVVEMLRTGDPNQQFFQKPSLYIYLLLAVLQLHYLLGAASGLYGPIGSMLITTHTVTTIPEFFFWARVVSASIGALTVATAYGFGARAWGRGAGLVGALFVATLPYHMRYSQFVTTDVTAAWLVLLCVGAALLIVREGRWQAYLVAGAFAGLAASAKYNAGAVALAVAAAAAIRLLDEGRKRTKEDERRKTKDESLNSAHARPSSSLVFRLSSLPLLVRHLGRAALAALAAGLGFLVGTPYALLRWDQVGGGIVRQWGNYDGRNGHYRGEWNIAGYADFFWGSGLGPLACGAVLLGLLIMLRRDWRLSLLWLSFALPSLLIHLSRPTHFMQNMLPLLVLCALPVGVAVVEGAVWIMDRGTGGQGDRGTSRAIASESRSRLPLSPRPFVPLSILALALLILLPTTLTSLARARELGIGDTRSQLLAWIDGNVPPGARIAAEIAPVPNAQEPRWSEVEVLTLHDLAWYRQQGFAYVIASSKRWGSLELPAAYQPLAAAGQLAEFGSREATQTLGPRIIVFSTGLADADVQLRPPGELRVGGARLLGLNVGRVGEDGLEPAASYRPGEALALRSFWQVEQPFSGDLFIFVHLLDASGNRAAQRDSPPWQGRYPTSSWRPGSLVVDVNDLYLPPNLPPGEYRLVLGMFDPASFARPPVTLDGAPLPDAMAELMTIVIEQ